MISFNRFIQVSTIGLSLVVLSACGNSKGGGGAGNPSNASADKDSGSVSEESKASVDLTDANEISGFSSKTADLVLEPTEVSTGSIKGLLGTSEFRVAITVFQKDTTRADARRNSPDKYKQVPVLTERVATITLQQLPPNLKFAFAAGKKIRIPMMWLNTMMAKFPANPNAIYGVSIEFENRGLLTVQTIAKEILYIPSEKIKGRNLPLFASATKDLNIHSSDASLQLKVGIEEQDYSEISDDVKAQWLEAMKASLVHIGSDSSEGTIKTARDWIEWANAIISSPEAEKIKATVKTFVPEAQDVKATLKSYAAEGQDIKATVKTYVPEAQDVKATVKSYVIDAKEFFKDIKPVRKGTPVTSTNDNP